jgi:GLPGLI family protein
MKRTSIIITSIFASLLLNAQENQDSILLGGKVVYEESNKLESRISGGIEVKGTVTVSSEAGSAAQPSRNVLPSRITFQKILLFNDAFAIYIKNKIEDQEERVETSGGMNLVIRRNTPENIFFTDIKEKKITESREFMTRKFLIESEFQNSNWKITGNQKSILNYHCIEAERTDSTGNKVKVWFTPEIQLPLGPGSYNNLPGLILAVDENDGQKTITAISIEPSRVDASQLTKPKEGKKVNNEEFTKIMADKMKEMKGENGGATFIIKR